MNSARIHKWKTFDESEFAASQHMRASRGNAYNAYKGGQHEDRAYHGQSEMNYSGMNYPSPVNICVVEEKKVNLGLCFQVCNVKKALIAVKRICEKGNQVSFGPKDEDNYIQNISTGDKIMMRPNGKG